MPYRHSLHWFYIYVKRSSKYDCSVIDSCIYIYMNYMYIICIIPFSFSLGDLDLQGLPWELITADLWNNFGLRFSGPIVKFSWKHGPGKWFWFQKFTRLTKYRNLWSKVQHISFSIDHSNLVAVQFVATSVCTKFLIDFFFKSQIWAV